MGKDWSGGPPPSGGVAHFQYDRVPRDRLWAVVFALVWAGAVVGGIYAIQHRSPAFLHTDFTDPASCPLTPNEGHRRLMEDLSAKHKGDFSLSAFMHVAGFWLSVSAALALGLGVAFIVLFKHHSGVMTRVTVGSQVAFPAAMALACLLAGQALGALMFGCLAALAAFAFYLWRGEIELATRLLGVSAHGLAANPAIVPATILLNLAAMLAITPLTAFLAFAYMNGAVVPNPARGGAAACVDPQGDKVLCCTWQPNAFAKAYMSACGATILWTMLLANQVRVFVTSGAVAQWYFAPPGALSAPRGTTRTSLRHALGPSFGSLCLSSLVLTISQLIKNAMDNASRNDRELSVAVVVKAVLFCIAQCFLSILEYVTKFATVMMAISGEAFLAAGRRVSDLLLRNLLNAFASTIWFTPMVIRLACLMLSLGWGLLSGGAFYALHRSNGAVGSTPGVNAVVLGSSVFVITQFVLSFIGGILLSVLDAVFICWAIDRDSQTVSHPEVYSVLQTVPIPGAVVEQPDGDILYGAGQAPPAGQTAAQPPAYQPPGVAHV